MPICKNNACTLATCMQKWLLENGLVLPAFLTISVTGRNIRLLCLFNWKLNTSSTASSAVNIRLSFGFKSFFLDSFEARLKSRKKTERRHDDKFVRTLNYYLRKIYVK